jgi:predicted lysophospholipase L1 biosynthesis ABC-type transport system permease subunit
MALGAGRGDILKMVLRQGFVLVGAGLLAGLVLTFVAARGIVSLLVGVSPSDPVTLISVALLLAAVGLVASYIPARRAMNIEPLRALKYESLRGIWPRINANEHELGKVFLIRVYSRNSRLSFCFCGKPLENSSQTPPNLR